MWKTVFKKYEEIWSAKANHIPSIYLKAVFDKLYLVHYWILCPKCLSVFKIWREFFRWKILNMHFNIRSCWSYNALTLKLFRATKNDKKTNFEECWSFNSEVECFFNSDYAWNKLMNKCTVFCYPTLDLSIPRKIG